MRGEMKTLIAKGASNRGGEDVEKQEGSLVS